MEINETVFQHLLVEHKAVVLVEDMNIGKDMDVFVVLLDIGQPSFGGSPPKLG